MSDDAFNRFWSAYPLRQGKGKARESFARAMKKTDLETILRAVEDYKRHKPAWRKWAMPTTWLNQERWDDEWGSDGEGQSAMDVDISRYEIH